MPRFVVFLALFGHLASAYYAPYPGSYYQTPFPAGSTVAYPSGTVVNYPAGTPITYPAGSNVMYNAPTAITYPQPTTVYYPTGPLTYPANSTVSYPQGSTAVYPPGTQLITADNTTTTYQPINGQQYGIPTYTAPTTPTYYNNPYAPTYFPPGTPTTNYYQPGTTNQFGPCPPPVGYTSYYQDPYRNWQYRTCTGYQSTGYPVYRTGPYSG